MKVREILRPDTEGTHFTIAQARKALRELDREREMAKKGKAAERRRKSAPKAR